MRPSRLILLMLVGMGCSRSTDLRDQTWAQMVDAHRRDVEVGGAMLHYIDLGAGQPVVMIHGIADSTYSWHNNAQVLLDAGLRLILVDQPGFGNSSAPDEWTYSVENQGDPPAMVAHLHGVQR